MSFASDFHKFLDYDNSQKKALILLGTNSFISFSWCIVLATTDAYEKEIKAGYN